MRYENSVSYRHLLVTIQHWDPKYAARIRTISERRGANRITNYLCDDEIERVREKLRTKGEAGIRFGVMKGGRGYWGEHGDFCLLSGSIVRSNIVLCYRRLELIGGAAYDIVLIQALAERLGLEWRRVTLFAPEAKVHFRRGNSNERLAPRLKEEVFYD